MRRSAATSPTAHSARPDAGRAVGAQPPAAPRRARTQCAAAHGEQDGGWPAASAEFGGSDREQCTARNDDGGEQRGAPRVAAGEARPLARRRSRSTTAATTAQPSGGSANSAASTSGIRTSAVAIRVDEHRARCRTPRRRCGRRHTPLRRGHLLAGAAEAPLALRYEAIAASSAAASKSGHSNVGEVELGVRELPEQEVAERAARRRCG